MNKYNNIKIDNMINCVVLAIFIVLSIYSFKYCEISGKYSINKIIISGNNFINTNSIEKIVEKNITNKNIFNINIKSTNQQIVSNNFIELSKIYTVFPSTISIVINEINPVGLFEDNNQYILVDKNYNLINADIKSINYYSVPIISMQNLNKKDIYRTINILEYITKVNRQLYDSIEEIIIGSEFSYIIVDNNTRIKLNKNNMERDTYKVIQFINDIKNEKYVNVSIPNQIIVKERKI